MSHPECTPQGENTKEVTMTTQTTISFKEFCSIDEVKDSVDDCKAQRKALAQSCNLEHAEKEINLSDVKAWYNRQNASPAHMKSIQLKLGLR